MKENKAKSEKYDEISQFVYDNTFAYNLLYKLGQKDKEMYQKLSKEFGGPYVYTTYGEPYQDSFQNNYIEYETSYFFPNGLEKCCDNGIISFISGRTIKDIINQIKDDNKAIKANALIDLTGKATKYADGLTPNYSKIFINAKDFKENIDDLISQAFVESNCKDLLICDERYRSQNFQYLIEVTTQDGGFGIYQEDMQIDIAAVEQCKQIAKKAVDVWQKEVQGQSALE